MEIKYYKNGHSYIVAMLLQYCCNMSLYSNNISILHGNTVAIFKQYYNAMWALCSSTAISG